VLARSVDPPGNSSGADHLETPSSWKLWRSCIPSEKNMSASQRQEAPQSRGWRCNFFQSGKSNRVNSYQGETGDTRPLVAHSSDNLSVSASTSPPLSLSTCPSGHKIGGSQGAHSSGDPPELVPPTAPSSSSALGSAAATALSPQSCPSGHDIGWIKRNGVRSQFLELEYLVLIMKNSKALPDPLPTWTPPCVSSVPNLSARQAPVA
jgi:hypothetical protein